MDPMDPTVNCQARERHRSRADERTATGWVAQLLRLHEHLAQHLILRGARKWAQLWAADMHVGGNFPVAEIFEDTVKLTGEEVPQMTLGSQQISFFVTGQTCKP